MACPLFNRIVTTVTNHDPYFHNNIDCTRREGISPLIKCTSVIRQLAYGVNANFLDEYMQISERSSRMALDHFCEAVMDIYGLEYLKEPTVTDIEKLYRHHEEKHGFSGMLGSLDCTDWEWFGRPYAFKGQYVRRDHAPEIPFVANGVSYPSRYYLVDGIYPELAPLVKTIPEPADDDHKQILYKQKQESARKDVERAFGVLKKKWLRYIQMVPEGNTSAGRLLRNEEQMERVMRWIRSSQMHQNLRHDLIEHLSRNV
ncbi:ALP1-like protein isoform X1 [Tanacetum coccineum]|uniref:ALP1-like protein isoform X1 n=1 Tax=Tanacetum coccineum TaxID=301880 RepID=A0ABQ5BCR5_9ASTR